MTFTITSRGTPRGTSPLENPINAEVETIDYIEPYLSDVGELRAKFTGEAVPFSVKTHYLKTFNDGSTATSDYDLEMLKTNTDFSLSAVAWRNLAKGIYVTDVTITITEVSNES